MRASISISSLLCACLLAAGCESTDPAYDAGGDARVDGVALDARGDLALAVCGNGTTEPGEDCDDRRPSAGCDGDCTKPACGDGVLNTQAGEHCDDGNKKAGDGCSAACEVEIPAGCGNNFVDPGEDCDHGGESTTCNVDCTKAACGDGKLNKSAGETCEDGNAKANDGCSESCGIEKPNLCGNGVCDPSESCAADGCQQDCGACKPGKPCVQDADCEQGLTCLVDSAATGGFSCGTDPGPENKPFMPVSGFSCAISLGSAGTAVWKSDGKGGLTIKGPVVIRTPTGDVPLTDKDVVLVKNGAAISATFGVDRLPTGVNGLDLAVSTTVQLAIISGKQAVKNLGGDEIVPDNVSYFEFTFGAALDNIIFSTPAVPGQTGKTIFETGKVKDVTLLRFLYNPCDPLAFLQVPAPLNDKGSQSLGAIGGSRHGGLRLETPLPLWDGKTTKVRAVRGHVYTQGTIKIPKVPLAKAVVGRVVDFDPRNDGFAHPAVLGAAFAGLLAPTVGIPANQADRAELLTGAITLGLPNPKAMADAVGLQTTLDLGPAGPLATAALYLYNDEKSVEILFRGRTEKSIFPGTVLESWTKLPQRDVQGYFRTATDWGLRYTQKLYYFLGLASTTTDVKLVVGGGNAELTLTGIFDISVTISDVIDFNLAQAKLTLHFDWATKELCGETQAVLNQAACTVRLCASAADKNWRATATCNASCGDGLCNGVESCHAKSPGCQKDCGKCPGLAPCTLDADCNSGKCPNLFCVTCVTNDHCSGNQWCSAAGTCEAPKPLNSPCAPTADYECQSGNCPAGLCTGCTVAKQDCAANRFCSALGTCEPTKSTGAVCIEDFECKNSKCVLGFCAKCNQQADCGTNQFCAADGKCYSKKKYGLPCVNGFECESGDCPVGMCVDCAQQSDCSGAWCAVDGKCYGKKPYGQVCVNHFECSSNKCIAGLCVDCTQQSHCGGGTWCDALGKCQGKKTYGTVCVNGFECASGRCPTGLCVDCVSQGHCSGGWCAADGKCYSAKNNGDVCINGFECKSNVCTGICVECVLHGHCNTQTEWCGVDTKCHPKANDGLQSPCLGSVECQNKCCLFFCGSWC